MNSIVAELSALVGGRGTQSSHTTSSTASWSNVEGTFGVSGHTFHNIAEGGNRTPVAPQSVVKTAAEQVIPLDDSEDFDDFND